MEIASNNRGEDHNAKLDSVNFLFDILNTQKLSQRQEALLVDTCLASRTNALRSYDNQKVYQDAMKKFEELMGSVRQEFGDSKKINRLLILCISFLRYWLKSLFCL